MYKDRLVGFDFELIEILCNYFDVETEIIDLTGKSWQEEFIENLVQIITLSEAMLRGK